VIERTVGSLFAQNEEATSRNLLELARTLARVGREGVAGVFLWPFLALPRLLFATNPVEFLRYGAIGLLILLVHYFWVINTDTSFEEASLELSQKVADRREARKRTRRTGGILVKKAAPFPWKLAPTGRPETALVWKNLVNLSRVTPVRALFGLTAFILAMIYWLIEMSHERGGLWIVAAALCALIAVFAAFLGPVFMRNDLREDLFRIDSIKTMPIAGHAIVWSEILGSWSALAALEVGLIGIGAIALLLSRAPGIEKVATPWLFTGGGAALFLLPGVTLVAVGLQNALVVLFPAWVALGNSRARGFEASGQRILTMFGTMFALGVVALPAAASGGVAAWLLAPHVGPYCLIVGALIAAAWMLAEVAFACRLLGGLVDRLDPSTAGIEAEDA
jgi:hypothetical protein